MSTKFWGSVIVCALAGTAWTVACGGSSDDGSGGKSTGGTGGTLAGGSGGTVSGGTGGTGKGGTSGVGGSGGTSGDSGTCAPTAPGSGWQPTGYKPAKVQLGSCTTAMLSDYLGKCQDSNEPPCAAFGASGDPAKQKCEACLWSKLGDSTWSAFVTYSKDVAIVNQAGCTELLGGEGAAECASAQSDVGNCNVEACKACMLGGHLPTSCIQDSQQGVCKSYADAFGKACQPFAQSYCLKGDAASAVQIAAAFCGPDSSDGGVEASTDAASDSSLD